jgi:hypothetical protein
VKPAPEVPAITHRQWVQWFEFSKVLGRLNALLSRCKLTFFLKTEFRHDAAR